MPLDHNYLMYCTPMVYRKEVDESLTSHLRGHSDQMVTQEDIDSKFENSECNANLMMYIHMKHIELFSLLNHFPD